ncbi:hypothetical protein L596_028514 [Steinernema carpocapsae]|uniref:Nucleoporin Nup133/Nup155-like N-terminal domain-containing protein n=1 Tax=Steinernema carpocapsae TaxID=34508 RepID=A0A4U5LYN0_STECR|nr:hypothetical protein L596_028514 [Steinernema carpocapsae]
MKEKQVELKVEHLRSSEHPVLVKEILSDGAEVCVSIEENGFCWLVHKNSMIVWNRLDQTSSGYPSAYTLALPSTGLRYSNEHICFYQSEDRDLPGVLAVSPEGSLRHYVQLDRKAFDLDIDLNNDIVVGVHPLNTSSGLFFLLSSSRSGFYMVEPSSHRLSSNGAVIYRELRPKEKSRLSFFLGGPAADPMEDVKRSYVFYNDRSVLLEEKLVATFSANSLKLCTATDTNDA